MIKRKAPLSLLVTLDSISKNTLDFFSVSQSRQCLQIIGCDIAVFKFFIINIVCVNCGYILL